MNLDLDAIRARVLAAHDEVIRLTMGGIRGRWRMSIPARPDHDSDLILSDALTAAEALLAAVDDVRALADELWQTPDDVNPANVAARIDEAFGVTAR